MINIPTVQERLAQKELLRVENQLREIVVNNENNRFAEGDKNYISYAPISNTYFGTLNKEGQEIFSRVKLENSGNQKKHKGNFYPGNQGTNQAEAFRIFAEGMLDKPLFEAVMMNKNHHKATDRLQDKKYIP